MGPELILIPPILYGCLGGLVLPWGVGFTRFASVPRCCEFLPTELEPPGGENPNPKELGREPEDEGLGCRFPKRLFHKLLLLFGLAPPVCRPFCPLLLLFGMRCPKKLPEKGNRPADNRPPPPVCCDPGLGSRPRDGLLDVGRAGVGVGRVAD